MGNLPERSKIIGNQLLIVDPLAYQWDKGARDAHVHKNHDGRLGGEDDNKLGIFPNGEHSYAKQAVEQAGRHGNSLRNQKLCDMMRFGKKEILCLLYAFHGSDNLSSLLWHDLPGIACEPLDLALDSAKLMLLY